MTKFLLDSDVLMDFFKKKEYAIKLIDQLLKEGQISTSILTITELRSGWSAKQAEFFLSKLYDLLKVLNLNSEIAELAGALRQEYKLKGFTLSIVDTLIAATVILEKCQLVTRNIKDYPMKNIKFYLNF